MFEKYEKDYDYLKSIVRDYGRDQVVKSSDAIYGKAGSLFDNICAPTVGD